MPVAGVEQINVNVGPGGYIKAGFVGWSPDAPRRMVSKRKSPSCFPNSMVGRWGPASATGSRASDSNDGPQACGEFGPSRSSKINAPGHGITENLKYPSVTAPKSCNDKAFFYDGVPRESKPSESLGPLTQFIQSETFCREGRPSSHRQAALSTPTLRRGFV